MQQLKRTVQDSYAEENKILVIFLIDSAQDRERKKLSAGAVECVV